MKYLELSLSDLRGLARDLGKKIEQDFTPDVVIFVARGGFLLGDEISKQFSVPLIEVLAVRETGRFKSMLRPILTKMPSVIKHALRRLEVKSNIHGTKSRRHVSFNSASLDLDSPSRIVIVDDSIDTGYTAKQVYDCVFDRYPRSDIRFAVLNKMSVSAQVFKIHYTLYEDYLINGPWSNDSVFHDEFCHEYEAAKKRGVFI